ncbi:unnamed protein product, partial [Meganyctiphanes norvegica]
TSVLRACYSRTGPLRGGTLSTFVPGPGIQLAPSGTRKTKGSRGVRGCPGVIGEPGSHSQVKMAGLMFYLMRLVVLPILIIQVYGLDTINILLSIATKLFVKGKKQFIVRTPEENFSNLDAVGYTFKPNYVELPIGGGKALPRLHYVDEGPLDAAETILCLHGEPSWSFLYRHMIPILVKAGYRVIVPDFIGFGKSDKYTYKECYTHEMHTQTLRLLLDHLNV